MRLSALGPALVGGFVLGGFALVVMGILFFGGDALTSRTSRVVVFFEGSVGGLSPGAPVTFRGLQVGSVDSVTLVFDVRDMTARIPVYLKLDPDRVRLAGGPSERLQLPALRQLIDAGLRAKLISQSFVTGEMLVELDLDPNTPARLVGGDKQDTPEIPAVPSDFEAFREQIMHAPIVETIAQARQTLATIEKLANRLDAGLDPLMADIARSLNSARQMMDTGRFAIVHLQQDASSMLAQGTSLAHDGRQQLAARGAELSQALQAAEQAFHSANALFITAGSIVAPRSRERDNFDAALRDLASSVSYLRGFSQALDRDPSILLHGRTER